MHITLLQQAFRFWENRVEYHGHGLGTLCSLFLYRIHV